MVPDLISNGLALFFVWLLATAGLHKLRDLDYYLNLLADYPIAGVPGKLIIVPLAGLELLLGVLLLAPQTRTLGLYGCAALLMVYGAAMAWQLRRGMIDIACGCAGPASTLTVSPALVMRNVLLAAVALTALASPVTVAVGLPGYTLSVALGAFIVVLYLCSDQLIANAQQMAGE